jgi:hypothetical protein
LISTGLPAGSKLKRCRYSVVELQRVVLDRFDQEQVLSQLADIALAKRADSKAQ